MVARRRPMDTAEVSLFKPTPSHQQNQLGRYTKQRFWSFVNQLGRKLQLMAAPTQAVGAAISCKFRGRCLARILIPDEGGYAPLSPGFTSLARKWEKGAISFCTLAASSAAM